MAAGQGFKTFVTGEVLTAGDVNGYLMQGINVFTNATARDAAITAPAEGQFAFTKDNNSLWYYDGAAWVASGATGDIEGVTAGVGISGGGTSGTVTITNSMATAIDAKGDLVVGTGADTFSRLAVGSNNQVLTADSTTATGTKWATVSAGGMTSLASGSLSGASTTISSIPNGYVNLFLVINGANSGTNSTAALRFSGVTSSVYGTSTTGSLGARSSVDSMWLAGYYNKSGNTENSYGVTINNYLGSYPTINSDWWGFSFNGDTYNGSVNGGGGSTGAVTSITILPSSGTWSNGTYTLYGVK